MQPISRRHFFSIAIGAVFWVTTPVNAAKTNLSDGIAIRGYDPVSYFTDSKAQKGKPNISATHAGATYYFTNEENKKAFMASPAQYAPQYGGFCAYAVSQGYTAPIDPQAFSVVNNKLYLNYSKRVRKLWSSDVPGHIKAGNKNWPELSAK